MVNAGVTDKTRAAMLTSPEIRVRRWWWKDVSGNVVLNVCYGNRRVELKSGKTAIEVGEMGNLMPTLKLFADAVKAGELDKVLLAMKGRRRQSVKAA